MKKLMILSLLIISMASQAQDNEAKYKKALVDYNKKVISYFYDALERKDYDQLKGIFDFNGRAVYSIASDTIKGREAIGEQFKASRDAFSKVKYTTEVNVMEDPTMVLVKVKSEFHTSNGMKQNNAMATFKIKNGKIVEYLEYDSNKNRS